MSKRIVSTILSLCFLSAISLGGQSKRQAPREAKESPAIETLRQIVSAQEKYKTTAGGGSYGTVQELATAGLVEFVDPGYAVRNGYLFSSLQAGASHFMVIALPIDFLEIGESSHRALLGSDDGIVSISPRDWRKERAVVTVTEEEASIVGIVRTLATAEAWYLSKAGGGRSFGSLDQLFKGGAIDPRLGSGERNGYRFAIVLKNNETEFEVFATPVEYGVTGLRSYYVSNNYVIHRADKKGARAFASDPALD